MTREEFEYLKTPQARMLIEDNLEYDPAQVALKLRNPVVATQIKNLQKCRTKLPSYYAALCIVPTISYEQSSSELAASTKSFSGGVALDLTCGLGVDSFALSTIFERVISLEIDPLRADIARWNFIQLGVTNIEVVCAAAEEYINDCPNVDLIYVDPSRRDETGRSVYAIDQCSPNVIELMPAMRSKSRKIVMKLSPLFDVEESFRIFGNNASCEVVTINNECKEVVVTISPDNLPDMSVTAMRGIQTSQFKFLRSQICDNFSSNSAAFRYLLVPDVGFYKSRTVSALMGGINHYYTGGYVLTNELPSNFCGDIYQITEVLDYKPKTLRSAYPRAIIHLRDFPYTIQQIGISQGGTQHLFAMRYNGKESIFIVE